jgi:hypothetical protein
MNNDELKNYIDEKFSALNANIEKIRECIEGNGNPGLKIRVDRIETGIKILLSLFSIGLIGYIVKLFL